MHEQIKQRIEQVINNTASLPMIPEVASKILNMVSNPDVSFKQVADEIVKDQAMTANILKLCNSAYFSKGKEITSIDRAMVTIGLKEVKDIVMVIATKPVLDRSVMGYDLAKGDLWKQGLVVANIAKKIALLKKKKEVADVVFTGGIIHNVGKVVLAMHVQGVFKEILETVKAKNITFNEAEKDVMGYDHQEIGEKILANWKFPPVLRSIVRHYLEPDKAPVEHKMEVSIVHIANAVSLMAGIGIGSDGLYHEIHESAVKISGITNEEITSLYEKVPEALNQIKDLL